MKKNETTKFEEWTLAFLRGQEMMEQNEVDLHRVKIWHQQILTKKTGGRDKPWKDERVENRLLGEETEESAAVFVADDRSLDATSPEPKSLLEVTIIISVSYTPLPQKITQDLLRTLLVDQEDQFIQSLNNRTTAYSYFQSIHSISSILSIDRVTLPPTPSPTVPSTPVVSEEEDETGPSLSLPVIIGLSIGGIWAFLALCSLSYLGRARDAMRREKQLKSFMEGNNDNHWMSLYENAGENKREDGKYDDNGDRGKYYEDDEGQVGGRLAARFGFTEVRRGRSRRCDPYCRTNCRQERRGLPSW